MQLFVKGLSDTLITVNIDFPGVSLTKQFKRGPVLGLMLFVLLWDGGLGIV